MERIKLSGKLIYKQLYYKQLYILENWETLIIKFLSWYIKKFLLPDYMYFYPEFWHLVKGLVILIKQ